MGSAASAGISAAVQETPDAALRDLVIGMPAAERTKLLAALQPAVRGSIRTSLRVELPDREVSLEDQIRQVSCTPVSRPTIQIQPTAGKLKPKHSLPERMVRAQKAKGQALMTFFRLPVPAARTDQLIGSGGLNLRVVFGMHAIAIEGEEGSVNVDVTGKTSLKQNQFIWFGLEGVFSFDEGGSHTEIPEKCVDNLASFVGAETNQFSLEYGHLLVCERDIPEHLLGQKLAGAGIRSRAGINLVALGKLPFVNCFPAPETIFEAGDKMYLLDSARKKPIQEEIT